ncbi:MAG: AAA family ATPase [Clostridiales Family XIII bacterium]|jgi:hypothetical protein|nr:AAA family ATPase [Clostridiales Family XIII bacterium]
MQNVFITQIHIDNVRHLRNVDIMLSTDDAPKRNHLILTGKNGSGKTSLLNALRDYIFLMQHKWLYLDSHSATAIKLRGMLDREFENITVPKITVSYSEEVDYSNATFVFISAERSHLAAPEAIEQIDYVGNMLIKRNASRDFYKYILNLDYQRNGAIADGNEGLAARLKGWFDNFNNALCEIYDCSTR